ncbi:MAG TPA: TetR/AcrR family transcriptional regulator [Vineibacter sp.]|nr:TetR/AcrR family transcriptional regulator [Vineibacter sp.]
MTTKPAARPGRPRDEATHRAILRAANRLLHEAGYGGFSIEGVALRAGVAKTSIYRRWPSKGALLLDLYMEGLAPAALEPSGKKVRQAFAAYLNQTVERLKDAGWSNTLRSLVAEAQNDPALARLVRDKVIEPRRADGRRLLEHGMKTGEIRKNVDIDITLDFVFGAIWYRLLLGHAAVDEAFARRVTTALFKRIGNDLPMP